MYKAPYQNKLYTHKGRNAAYLGGNIREKWLIWMITNHQIYLYNFKTDKHHPKVYTDPDINYLEPHKRIVFKYSLDEK